MCAHGRFCPGEPREHSLNGVLSGTMHSQEARVGVAKLPVCLTASDCSMVLGI